MLDFPSTLASDNPIMMASLVTDLPENYVSGFDEGREGLEDYDAQSQEEEKEEPEEEKG